jgi:hypothetical protein
MSIAVHVAKNILSKEPFSVLLTSDSLVSITVTLKVEDEARAFALTEEDGTAHPKASSQVVNVDGSLLCTVSDWGEGNRGDTAVLSGEAPTGKAADFGIVL